MQPIHRGKVRDIYEVDTEHLLMVTSDRISAFDVVMNETIPDKGRVLCATTSYWLDELADVAPHHLVSFDPADFSAAARSVLAQLPDPAAAVGRAMLVRRASMLPIECIVRGRLTGSAWKEYKQSGTMHGQRLPAGLSESDELPEPAFTPSTKAQEGHDINISEAEAAELVGAAVLAEAKRISLTAFNRAAALAAQRGIVIADTKFELGFIGGALALCDEVCTPDSSRFWPADQVVSGATPPSFDKQPLRDWLEQSGWDKTAPPPTLPAEVVVTTAERYRNAYERVSGRSLRDWPGGR